MSPKRKNSSSRSSKGSTGGSSKTVIHLFHNFVFQTTSSGKLQLFDATGSVDIVVPDIFPSFVCQGIHEGDEIDAGRSHAFVMRKKTLAISLMLTIDVVPTETELLSIEELCTSLVT
ncbi:hypothetical protein KSP40_PGU017036 [Platanthera guangdongensis]|uniref:Uncharacterized protein n=1 Tax=Platanthera guangdongensis TaxID=2320717 RepID=A0ABR2MTW2_9ASPA